MPDLRNQNLLFVTGHLAENSLREILQPLSQKLGFRSHVTVPGVQVAALLHVDLLKRRLTVPADIDRVILPGWVQGNIQQLEDQFGCPVIRGPKDLYDLPEFFGEAQRPRAALDRYSIEIIGEINHATRQPLSKVIEEARAMHRAGADVIDVGCVPGESSHRVGEIVRRLRSEQLRVSIDSFDRSEVEQAVEAGAELILSCNQSNVDWVTQLQTEVVLIPETPSDLPSLDRLIEQVSARSVPFRVDPILEPIGMGFTASLQRYLQVRQCYPDVPMMMGVGNLTELTEVDSAGVNLLMAAVCEELGIQSVLTTQVAGWCRGSVAELDVARRMVHHSIQQKTLPKHLGISLVMLRDARRRKTSSEALQQLASAITDGNFRIFAADDGLHLMNRRGHWIGEQPFEIFGSALQQNPDIDAAHAFYLGFEMARAEMARLLGKHYVQDEGISWGLAGQLPGSATVHHRKSSDPGSASIENSPDAEPS
ncbi:MAG: DUF6513 domain-containing protein [Planctomycetaceae bacterium]